MPGMPDDLRIVPANQATTAELDAVFERGDPARCRCQWFKISSAEWHAASASELADRLREQAQCGHPHGGRTSGLIAFVDDRPVGWCAVEPRTAYPRMRTARIPWAGRDEDRSDGTVWAVTCFVVRAGFRRRGVGRALACAAVDHARDRGARAIEGYPLVDGAGTSAERFVGTESMFADAGFTPVSQPSERRVVMRRELTQ